MSAPCRHGSGNCGQRTRGAEGNQPTTAIVIRAGRQRHPQGRSGCPPLCQPARSWILDGSEGDFLQLVSTFVWVNPNLSLCAEWRLDEPAVVRSDATDPNWTKWRPNMPTSPHWYDVQRLSRLMAAEVAHAEDHAQSCPTVREFICQFRGLSGTAKDEGYMRIRGRLPPVTRRFPCRRRRAHPGAAGGDAGVKQAGEPPRPRRDRPRPSPGALRPARRRLRRSTTA